METSIEQLRPGQAVNGAFALRVKKLLLYAAEQGITWL